jgi:GDP-L-fucose synthase
MMNAFWENRRVCVTGGAGFLGSYIVEKLERRGCRNLYIPMHEKYELVAAEAIRRMYDDFEPNIVIHLAALVGGIGPNSRYPGQYFYDNLMMGCQLLHEAYLHRVDKFVAIGTACCYPKETPVPFNENDIWNGPLDDSTGYYGAAKKMLLVQSQAYRKQYGFNSIFLMPTNLYGPRDNYDTESSHVIPALIKRIYEAAQSGASELVVWGDGTATREFIHATDAADAILLATENYNSSEPVNIGTGCEISISDLVKMISEIVGYAGSIKWDCCKPNGQPRRCMDVTRAEKEFGFKSKIDLADGLRQTVEWYAQRIAE